MSSFTPREVPLGRVESSPYSNERAVQGSRASSAQLPSGLPVGVGLSSVHPRGRGLLGGQGQSLVWVARCLPGGLWSGGQLVHSVSRACLPAHLLPAVLSLVGRGPEPFKYQKLCAQTQMRWGRGQWSPHVKCVPGHCAWPQSCPCRAVALGGLCPCSWHGRVGRVFCLVRRVGWGG